MTAVQRTGAPSWTARARRAVTSSTRVRTHQKLTAAVVAALDEVEYVVKGAGYHAPQVRLLCALHGVRLAGAGLTVPARKVRVRTTLHAKYKRKAGWKGQPAPHANTVPL